MPTTDERLDRLTERHEALAEGLELLTADVRSLAVSAEKQSATAAALLAISSMHHDRIKRLEDRQ